MEEVTAEVPDRSSVDTPQRGRKRSTSRVELEHIAFELFAERGFERTTIDDIAIAAGIGRRTFFRYFPSKNDVAWGKFDEELVAMRARFAATSPDTPLMDALRQVVVEFNRFPAADEVWHRRRMALILKVPALQAHSTLRYADWRAVVADFAASRLGLPPRSLAPQAIAHAALGVAVAAYEQWLADPAAELTPLLDLALLDLASGFARS
jgi:mycofactocin system transcriptional regulator